MLKKMSAPFIAFLQASGLVAYLIIISTFFNFMGSNFDQNAGPYFSVIIMLLLFVMSAVISALLILGRSGFLFWEKRYKESFTLIAWTVGWGIFYLALFLLMLFTQ